MKRFIFILFFFFALSLIAQEEVYFISNPTLSPDGEQVVFCFENDLWQVNAGGGTAYRITAMEGEETNPRFSPDGKWIAFSSDKLGNSDVYVMPVSGGTIQQLTWNDADDKMESWSWDSKTIYFSSGRYNQFATYSIPFTGGTPKRLFTDHYFVMPHNFVEDPLTKGFYFNESWESSMFVHRKRYKGDHNPDIKYYHPQTDEFKVLTTYEGKDMFPVVDSSGKLYFTCDEGNNEYNLYTFTNDLKTQLTNFESSIYRPQVSASGDKVVFEKDYQLFVYDVKENMTTKLDIQLSKNETLLNPKSFNVKGNISYFDISPDKKKIAFISRGRLFVSDLKGDLIKLIETDEKERILEVKWLEDNQTLIYIRTTKGWANFFKISVLDGKKEKQLTFDEKTNRQMELNEKRTKAAYISGNDAINILEIQTEKVETIVKDEFWFRGSTPRFSPDDNYLLFAAYRNFESDIFIYSFQDDKKINITNTGVAESDPYWSPDGKYIYLAADRFHTGFPRGTESNNLYRIPLYKFQEDFKKEELNRLLEGNKKDTSVNIILDFDKLESRWEKIGVRGGQQYEPHVYHHKKKIIITFNSTHEGGTTAFYKIVKEPYENPETKKIFKNSINQQEVRGDKLYFLSRGDLYEVKLDKEKQEKIEFDYDFSIQMRNEFEQMYYENWAALAENFYDLDYHGVDWKLMKKRYERFLPYLNNRSNLRRLLNDQLGELNASHLSFYSNGEEEEVFYDNSTAATGIYFNNSNPCQVERVVDKSPLDLTHEKVKPGDILIGVNGIKIDPQKNREKYFASGTMPEELQLTFSRNGKEFEVLVHPVSSGRLDNLLYDEWIDNNQKYVDQQTDGKVGYVYMKNMGSGSLEDFIIDMTTEVVHKDALILDLRYNRGGNVHDDVLKFLSQTPYLQWKYRNGKMGPQPNFAPSGKPIVMLVNEHSLSDAEMTAAGFKQLELGTIIGTETYRWIIFTSGRELVDGSFTRLPSWGCYDLEGNDLELTGVKPDIYVENTFYDKIKSKDPQLDKAIQEVLTQLK